MRSNLKYLWPTLMFGWLIIVGSQAMGQNKNKEGTVTGRVVMCGRGCKIDKIDDAPPAVDVRVFAFGNEDPVVRRTNNNGEFTFPSLPRGHYDLQVKSDDCRTCFLEKRYTVYVTTGSSAEVTPNPVQFKNPDVAIHNRETNRPQIMLVLYRPQETGEMPEIQPQLPDKLRAQIINSIYRPLSGAEVTLFVSTLVSDKLDVLLKLRADKEGNFEIPLDQLLQGNTYYLRVSQAGYDPFVAAINARNPSLPKQIILQPEGEEAPLVETSEAIRRYVFLPRIIQTLPFSGLRTFDSLALLAPGVLPPPATLDREGPGISPGVGTAGQLSVNGLRSRENNFTVDGSDNNDEEIGARRQGFVALAPQSLETLQEVQVITALGDARFGRNIGGQVNALTISGGKTSHGSAFGFLTDHRLNARDFFDGVARDSSVQFPLNRAIDNKPVLLDDRPIVFQNPVGDENPFTRVQIGGVLGGPVRDLRSIISPKKADSSNNRPPINYYFTSFERQVTHSSKESPFAVPSVDQRGVFESGETGVGLGSTQLYPASIPGNAIFSLYPFSNNPLGPYGHNTYTAILPADGRGTRFSIRFDQYFNKNNNERIEKLRNPFRDFFSHGDLLTVRFNLTDESSVLPSTAGAISSSLRPNIRTQNLALFYSRTLSSNTSDTIRGSYARTALSFEEVLAPYQLKSFFFPDASFLLNAPLLLNVTTPNNDATRYVSASSQKGMALLNKLGYGNFPVTQTEQISGPLGQVMIAGFSPVGVDAFNFPQGRSNNTSQVAYTLTNSHRSHVFTAGFDMRKPHINSRQERNYRPLAVFQGLRSAESGSAIPIKKPGGTSDFTRVPLTGATLAAAGVPTGLFHTLGIVTPDSKTGVPNSNIEIRYTQTGFFFNDEYRVNSALRLLLGVRYEFNRAPHTTDQRLERAFDRDALLRQAMDIAPACQVKGRCDDLVDAVKKYFQEDFKVSVNGDLNNFNPRVGFTWAPSNDGKTAIRGGWGAYSGQFPSLVISQSRNAFPNFIPLNLANFSPQSGTTTFLFNLANPAVKQLDPMLNLVKANTLNSISPGNPFQLLVNQLLDFPSLSLGVTSLGLDVVQPQRKLKAPYSFQYALTIEHQFFDNYLGAVSYVGTRGVKLLRVATPDTGLNNSRVAFSDVRPLDGASALPAFPFFQGAIYPSPALISKTFTVARSLFESSASSTYNSLQLEVRKRYSRHFQFGTAFTYSHTIDDASDFFDTAGAFALMQNNDNRRAERASANFDVRLRSVTNFIWDVPFREGKYLGDWQIAGVITAQSGQPFTVNSAIDVNRDGNLTDRLNTTNGIISGASNGDNRTQLHLAPGVNLLDLLAPDSRDGVVGRNTFRASGVVNVDLAFTKAFNFSDRYKILLRTEVFNLLNRTHFGIPVRILEFPSFGSSVNTATPARMVQVVLKLSF